MSEQRDIIDLDKLTDYQKRKLIKFYEVKSINDLEVKDDGNIVVKKTGGAKPKELKVFIEDYEGKLTELNVEEFLTKQKDPSLAFTDMTEDKARSILRSYLDDVISHIKKADTIKTMCIEHIGKSSPELLLFQQFIIYHADKLKRILCGNEINLKYIKGTGNPGYSEVDLYNIYKKSTNELVIKGFAFCDYPSKQELFINLVCGTGGTGKLIESLLQLVSEKKLNTKAKYISLDSIETEQALEFYTKMGFRKPKKNTCETIDNMIASKSKSFSDYADEKLSKAGGKLYLFPHNAEGEKELKKLKCEWLYSPVKWFDTIQQLKKEKKPKKYIKEHMIETMRTSKLEGDGIGDFFKDAYSKVKDIGSSIVNRFKPKLDDFTNQSKATLAKYGDWKIVNMTIQRKPIMGILDKFFNVLTFGKFEELKKKYGYDKLFHLQLGVDLMKDGQRKKVILEKNETVDITEGEAPSGSQVLPVPISNRKIVTLNQLVDGTRQRVGDNSFFSYDPFNNNCQFFIRYLLESMGEYREREKSFLFQDMSEFQKELPKWLPGFSRSVTDLGATVANLRGKGLEGGVGARKYITASERDAKRNEAIRASTYAPTVEARKEEEARMKGIQDYNETVSKKPKKKTIKDYQAEERYYKDLRAKEEAEKKAKEAEEKATKEKEDSEKKAKEDEEKATKEQEKKDRETKKAQRDADVKAYKEGRIDDIKDNELRSRAQTERNLGQFYDFKDKVYKTKIAQAKENMLTNLLPMALEKAISKVPVIGDATRKIIDATGVKGETSDERKRREYLEQGPPIRPDVLEGYREGTGTRRKLKKKKVLKKK